MKALLRMNSWQIFLILIGLPILLEIGTVPVFLSQPIGIVIAYMIVFILVTVFLLVGWAMTLGTNLHKKLPKNTKLKIGLFKFNIGYFIGYQLLFGAFMAYVMTTMPESPLFLLIFPFHLYAMFCGLYAMYFISKALVSVEKQEDVDYNQFGGVFLMLLFFPIGIWFLQPRIQKIFK